VVSFKELANLLPRLPEWNPVHATPRSFEVLSILGPFLSRSSVFSDVDPIIASTYFPNSNSFGEYITNVEGSHIGNRNASDVKSAMNALRDLFSMAKSSLSKIVLDIIKSGPDGKEGVLSLFGKILELNVDRGKMQMDPRQVATHGFMHNLAHICLSLCDPILDFKYSKLPLINDNYLYFERLDVSEETRINADKAQVDKYVEKFNSTDKQPVNFITEIFFMTISYHHYGILSTIRYFNSMHKQLSKMMEQLNKLRQDQMNGAWSGPMEGVYISHFKKFQVYST
jgi:ubiquitin conjugation factor E4 B